MKLKRSQQFFWGGISFLVGIAFGDMWQAPVWAVGVFLLLLGFNLFIFKEQRLKLLLVMVVVLGFGWSNGFNPNINEKHLAFYNNEYKSFAGRIMAEPDKRLDKQKLTIKADDFRGKVLVTVPLYPEYNYGDKVKIGCKLQKPEPIENFKYDRYLAKSGVYSVCYQPKISLIPNESNDWSVVSGVLEIKKSLEKKINLTLAEPQASLMAGILIGSRTGIPADLLEKFSLTGITHIIAISGFNITIIVVLLMNLSKHLYINRKKAIWGIGLGLVFFVILTGMSPSVLRAAVMGMIVVLAKHLGRVNKVSNALVLTAVIMTVFNPKILIWDAGFQLSFLATIGLIYLSPKLERYFNWVPEKFALRENLISTMSAIIITLPLILFQFGRLSLVAPIVNLLVLPVIPVAMFVGFIQVVLSFVYLGFGSFIGWFSWLLLSYVIKVVEFFSWLPWAAVEVKIGLVMMVVLYVGIGLFGRKEHLK